MYSTVRRGFIMQTQQQEWIVRCAYRLRQRWRTIDAQSLEHVAKELLRDESLRKLDPEEAAREWLAEVHAPSSRTRGEMSTHIRVGIASLDQSDVECDPPATCVA
jgi:hypothetical protein